MKTLSPKKSHLFLLFLSFIVSFAMSAQVGGWKADLVNDSEKALSSMIEKAPKLQPFYDKSYGYAVYPKITKGGLGIGGAVGQGIVYKDHSPVGSSSLKQATFGLQAGGQQYSEVIFFENEEAFNNFKNGKLKFDAQASAVAITLGASIDVAYKNGVAVFTQVKGGLMYEASIGGQHFSFKEK
ncbi:MAG: YSC84-related protein [Flavobacteriaceae bacterium]|nr:YSC84-related protein [Flavobacteriaceae bacterium]